MEKLLSPSDLAQHLGLALQTIYNRRMNGGSLPRCINTGRLIRFRQCDVEEWLTLHYEDVAINATPTKPEMLTPRPRGRPTKAVQVGRRNRG